MMSQTTYRLTNAIAVVISGLAVGIALLWQATHQLHPCPLCILQRLALFTLIILFLWGSLPVFRRRFSFLCHNTLILLTASTGTAIAARQVWLQHLPPEAVPGCGPGLEFLLKSLPWHKALQFILQGSGECATVAFRFFGLSIAEWSLALFSALTLFALIRYWFLLATIR